MIPVPCQRQGPCSPRSNRLKCSKKGQLVLGIMLMITASITFALGIASVALPTLYYGYFGNPLWTGTIIMAGGILCVCSSKIASKCTRNSAFVMNIISIVFAINQIVWMSVAAANEYWGNDNCFDMWNSWNWNGPSDSYTDYRDYTDCTAEVAIDSVLIALGVIELALSIAAVCVLSVDLCCPGTQRAMGVMHQVGQPLVIQSGFSPSGAPSYPPQTHFVNPSGQMYVPLPTYQVQYAGGQLQPYPANLQFQQQFPAGQPQPYQPGGQPQQYQASGQQQQHQTQPEQQNPTGGQSLQSQQQYPTAGQYDQGTNPLNPPAYNEQK